MRISGILKSLVHICAKGGHFFDCVLFSRTREQEIEPLKNVVQESKPDYTKDEK